MTMVPRIVQVGNGQYRKYGHTRVSWVHKLYRGLVQNCCPVYFYSDRDTAAFEAPFGLRDLGKRTANRRLRETIRAQEPDLLILCHCDIIRNETVAALRDERPNMTVVDCNNDPMFVPENIARIRSRLAVVDAVFTSTGRRAALGAVGDTGGIPVYHMPNPVDAGIECADVSQKPSEALDYDLVFCGKASEHSDRMTRLEFLYRTLDDELRFAVRGCFGQPNVWGLDYDRLLAASKMGLSLNRQEGWEWYASARMAQLVGNGLLTFCHRGTGFDSLFPDESVVYFETDAELLERIREFHRDDAKRRAWAAHARAFMHAEFSVSRFASWIVERSLGLPLSHRYAWNH